jgi:superfamily II DNA or RNA helicase
MTDLRPYQTECLQSVKKAYRAGLRRVLVSLPTGTGKTVVFASFPEFFKMQKRMLVLAHREELLDQARKKFRERAPDYKVGIEQGDRQAAAERAYRIPRRRDALRRLPFQHCWLACADRGRSRQRQDRGRRFLRAAARPCREHHGAERDRSQSLLQKARDRQCIVFCVDVQHSKDVADRFSRAGIRTAAVWGDMPCDERKDALKKFASGKIKVLTNCNILTEGFDEPSVSCVLLARPTKSLLLYAQMVDRGTRLHPGKTDVRVIDIVDNSEAHTLAGLNRLFELPDSMDLRGHDVLKTLQRVREIGHRYPWVDVNGVSKAGDLDFVMERVDLFRCEPPPEVAAISEFVWMPLPGEGYRLCCRKSASLWPRETLGAEVHRRSRGACNAGGERRAGQSAAARGAMG